MDRNVAQYGENVLGKYPATVSRLILRIYGFASVSGFRHRGATNFVGEHNDWLIHTFPNHFVFHGWYRFWDRSETRIRYIFYVWTVSKIRKMIGLPFYVWDLFEKL